MHLPNDGLMLQPVLALCNSGSHVTLDTEASDVQVGCLLLQEQPGRTVMRKEYRAGSFTDVELGYENTKKISDNRVCRTFISLIYSKYQLHHKDEPSLPNVDSESDGWSRKTRMFSYMAFRI